MVLIMRKFIVLIALAATVAQAEVYKSTNDKGEVIYSDIPSQGAERVKLPSLPTYTAPPLAPSTRATRDSAENAFYENFSFNKPKNDETVRNNLGIIMIETRLAPALQTKLRHRIQFYLDGEPNGPLLDRTAITLSNIERGAHTLSASVLDKDGKVLISTGDVTVHIKRESALHDQQATETDNPSNRTTDPNLLSGTPNQLSTNPNVRTNTPNVGSQTPNLRSTTPNIINPPAPKPAPLPSTGGK